MKKADTKMISITAMLICASDANPGMVKVKHSKETFCHLLDRCKNEGRKIGTSLNDNGKTCVQINGAVDGAIILYFVPTNWLLAQVA